jgi:hypothetical protein
MRITRCLFSHSLSFGVRNLRDDGRGTIAVTTALCATVLFGLAGLAVDVASWEVAQHSMQGAADAAAYSAWTDYSKNGGNFSQAKTQAQGITAAQGYVNGQNGVTVAVNQPPKSGGYTGDATAIEVIIQQPQPRFFSGLFLAGNPAVSARSVSVDPPGTGSPCVLSLSATANPGITFSGGSNVNTPGCDIVSDSNVTSGNDSAELSGSATVTTACLVAVGTVDESGNSTLNLTKCTTPTTHAQPVADPYLGVTDPPPMPANQGSCTNGPGNTVNCTCPGGACYFTNDPNPNGTATFAPGLYYFEQGFSVGGGTATGTDVTFFIATGRTAAVSGNANVTFSAPTAANCISSTCPYAGIVYMGSRTSNGQNNNFSGGSSSAISGAIYFPSDNVSFTGNSSSAYNACTQIVASTITISGKAQLSNSCNATLANDQFADGASGTVKLVE